MNYNDILTLAKAGFNAQQIGALMQLSQNQQGQLSTTQNVQQNFIPTVSTQQNQVVEGMNIQQPNYDPYKQQMDALAQQITGLTQVLQLNNIGKAQQPAVETTHDILASIINPPNITGGEKDVN